jgi:hypothetical protein
MTTAAAFKAWINSDAPFELAHADPALAARPLVPHHLGALIGHLNRVCGGDGERRSFLKYCFDVDSSKLLHVRHINALYYWLRVQPDAEGAWHVTNAKAAATAAAVVRESLLAAGQMEMPL